MAQEKPIIPCQRSKQVKDAITSYAQALKEAAPSIGSHGLNESEFWDSGIFQSAIEKLRGTQAASMQPKRQFVENILDYLQTTGAIQAWDFTGSGERHDYEVSIDGRLCVIETKGCLDGNNTNIFERPPNADEFVIWSLCQNPGSDPRHNAWSGIHTRLSAEIIHRKQQIDGLIIWDMICATPGRPCPKLLANPARATLLQGKKIPPPCIYLFPRTIPDPRNNPNPKCSKLQEVAFLDALVNHFNGHSSDIVDVNIEAKMEDADIKRKTCYYRENSLFLESNWTKIKRAR